MSAMLREAGLLKELAEAKERIRQLEALLASLRLAAEALHALTDRNVTYIGNVAVLPFESNAQAFNHMIDARRHAKEARAMLAAAPAKEDSRHD